VPTRVAIACQGGGSHTAFTAGVLDRLCGDVLDTHEVVGLSGTSGGAVCALLAWYALRDDDPAAAGRLLAQFWADNSASSPWEQLLNASAMLAGNLQEFVAMPAISPYDNVLSDSAAEEFKAMLWRRVDFDRVEPAPEEPVLVIGAVDVLSGEFRAFDSRRDRISAETVLASARDSDPVSRRLARRRDVLGRIVFAEPADPRVGRSEAGRDLGHPDQPDTP
jgi:NTE family protein